MKLGAFLIPSHPPERGIGAGIALDLEELERLDSFGFAEAWIGEHFTSQWEPCPAPDLLIAQALPRTTNIRLGSLGHLLPYHHPVELAHRVAYLDHMAQGRYNLGVGISALPTDHQLFALDTAGGRNRRMTFEALRIMTDLWIHGAREFDGEFWNVGATSSISDALGYHLRPYQLPHPPIAIAALTPGSENHKLAGANGYLPVSLSISPDDQSTAKHWSTVATAAAEAGRVARRSDWRIIRDVYVAPTDTEARDCAMNGMMGRCWQEFLLPLYLQLGLGAHLKIDPKMADEDITLDYLCDRLWVVGSPTTVATRLQELDQAVGGFGTLLITSYDVQDERASWERSLSLLTEQVLPLCQSTAATNSATAQTVGASR